MSLEAKCHQCGKSGEREPLSRCPVCHKMFCEEHATVMSGRRFCSQGCAEFFFFSPEDD